MDDRIKTRPKNKTKKINSIFNFLYDLHLADGDKKQKKEYRIKVSKSVTF